MKKIFKAIGLVLGGIVLFLLVLSLLLRDSSNVRKLSSQRISGIEKADMAMMSAPSVLESRGSGLLSMDDSLPNTSSKNNSKSSQDIASDEINKKVIKNGNLNLKVDKVDKALEEIRVAADKNKGEIFSSKIYQESDSKAKSGRIEVKVPVDNFETAFEDLKKVASLVVSESTSGKDVTEQYADLQAQLKNKQAEEQSIVKILDRAGTITEVLSVTRELSRVRGEIEVLQGRIKLMDSQTEMATININLSEDIAVVLTSSWRPLQVVKNAVNSLVNSVQGFINIIIRLIIVVIPVLLLYGILFLIFYRIGRKIYRKIKGKETTPNQ